MGTDRKLTIAVVGLGHGTAHIADALDLREKVELIASVDPVDPRTDAQDQRTPLANVMRVTPWYPSLTRLLADRVPDIVVLATPIHTHLDLAKEALAAGSHVLLEKPPTASLAEHEELVEAARVSERAVQVGFQARGSIGLERVRELLAAGHIGKVEGVGAIGLWMRDRSYYRRAAWAGHRVIHGRPVMDGALTNPFAHALDVALMLDGATDAAHIRQVQTDAWHAHDIRTDDTMSAIIQTGTGISIALGLTLCAERVGHEPYVAVRGSHGTIQFDYTRDIVTVTTAKGTTSARFERVSLLENLVDHIRGEAQLLAPIESTGGFMAVLDAVRAAAPPRQISEMHLTWHGRGESARPVVKGVDMWCNRVAESGLTFTELGAPWTRKDAALR